MAWYNRDKEPTFTAAQAEDMIEQALLKAASGQDAGFRARQIRASGGYDFSDQLHNIYSDFGYPASLTFPNFWNMYRRLGIAKGVVQIPPDQCWLTPPEVKANDAFKKSLDEITTRLNLWVRLKGL